MNTGGGTAAGTEMGCRPFSGPKEALKIFGVSQGTVGGWYIEIPDGLGRGVVRARERAEESDAGGWVTGSGCYRFQGSVWSLE